VDSYSVILKSNTDITKLVELLKEKIRFGNPLIGKLFEIRQGRDGFYPIMKRIPELTFKDVILNEKLKEDIYDNTIFQLEHLKENNGVIFHGDPGVGKSLVCSAIANEVTEKGYTVAYLSTQVDYSMLNEFIEAFISPCVLIFEDIDAFGESRDSHNTGLLSEFLQFINGITERDERMIFIATTNYLDRLDKAIANRPVRFNRKFEFKYPSESELDRLVKLYFNDDISEKFSVLCYNKEFSGSHIKEVQRTVNLLSKKRNQTTLEVFEESVQLVHDNFSPKLNPMGFNG
jgi:SpoVK/Ycf46/Vps4 family AAA+-type ATPase